MEESGSFRTSIKGFHKQDVLEYIDSMQSRYMMDLQAKENQITHLKKAASEQETKIGDLNGQVGELANRLEELKKQAEDLGGENAALKQHQEDTGHLRSEYRQLIKETEILRLEKKDLSAHVAEMQTRINSVRDLERQIRELGEQLNRKNALLEKNVSGQRETEDLVSSLRGEKEELEQQLAISRRELKDAETKMEEYQKVNRSYDDFVGDVGSFIMELRSMGQRFLETAYKRSDSCLKVLESSVAAVSSQLTDASTQVGIARQELLDHGTTAGMRLDELVQALEESAETIANPEESPKDSAAGTEQE